MATSRLKFKVKGQGGVVTSWRDLGREGHGREYANGSPYVRNGHFIQGHKMGATRESGPGLPLSRRNKVENPNLKKRHKLILVNGLCLKCHMFKEGHERLIKSL